MHIRICRPLIAAAIAFSFAAQATAREEVTIYRDDFGTPHIYAETAEGACFANGYAQATDRLEELLKQYLRCTGRMAEAFGSNFLNDDYRQRVWRHAEVAKAKYPSIAPKSKALIEAYLAGVRQYMAEHPSEVPAWAPELEPWMCVALGRYVLWGWPEGEANDDLERIGLKGDPVEYHGSNEWLVAKDRTAYGAPIALIDPHLSWYDAFRFYEVRLYGGELEISGMSILGQPLPGLGHNRYCSVAMTTGGPDTSDVFEEELNPENPRQYKVDGRWGEMDVKTEVIRVKTDTGFDEKKVDIEYTRHGPVVARKDGKAYVFAIPYAEEVGLMDQTYLMMTAKNLDEMKRALSMQQLMMQNIMVGTVQGDIYYVRVGRVPRRAPGADWKRATPGNSTKNDWQGIHPFADLVQIENPPEGYMQNCNISPQFLFKGCTLVPNPEAPYLFNGFKDMDEAHDNPLHQRAAMCVELLHGDDRMTIADAIEVAMSPAVFGADKWQARLRTAWNSASAEVKQDAELAKLYGVIVAWNLRCDPDATGAVAYKYWKQAFGDKMKLADRLGMPPSADVTDDLCIAKLREAMEKLKADFGRVDIAYGDVYRVGRRGSDKTWPVGGGSNDHIATPRAISFEPIEGTQQFRGRGGQTSTQVVLLTNPPQSWTVLPLGESDQKNSPHFDDQARRVFSKGTMKPTYFLQKDELIKNAESKSIVVWNGKSR
jgi:acyl-homoserine lactone acylase PvdQ